MQLPKNSKNPLNTLPFFCDPEDPYMFQTYMFQVFRNLAVAQATQVEQLSKEIISWVLQEWWAAIDRALTEHNQKIPANYKNACTITVPLEIVEFTAKILSDMKGNKKKKADIIPEREELFEELKKNGLTPKSVEPVEKINPLKPAEVLDTNVPSKERRKKPQL